MPFFPLMAFQHWVLAIFLGLIFLILVYLAFGSDVRRQEGRVEGELEERDSLWPRREKSDWASPDLHLCGGYRFCRGLPDRHRPPRKRLLVGRYSNFVFWILRF